MYYLTTHSVFSENADGKGFDFSELYRITYRLGVSLEIIKCRELFVRNGVIR